MSKSLSQPRKIIKSNRVKKGNIKLPNSKPDKSASYSKPRNHLDADHSWEFYPELLQEDFSKIRTFVHKGLKREAVDADHLNSTVLHGMMNVNLQCIPSIKKKKK